MAPKLDWKSMFFLTKAVSGGQGGGGCRLWLLLGRVLEESDFLWFFDRQKKHPKTGKNWKNVTLGRQGRVDLVSTAGGRKAQKFWKRVPSVQHMHCSLRKLACLLLALTCVFLVFVCCYLLLRAFYWLGWRLFDIPLCLFAFACIRLHLLARAFAHICLHLLIFVCLCLLLLAFYLRLFAFSCFCLHLFALACIVYFRLLLFAFACICLRLLGFQSSWLLSLAFSLLLLVVACFCCICLHLRAFLVFFLAFGFACIWLHLLVLFAFACICLHLLAFDWIYLLLLALSLRLFAFACLCLHLLGFEGLCLLFPCVCLLLLALPLRLFTAPLLLISQRICFSLVAENPFLQAFLWDIEANGCVCLLFEVSAHPPRTRPECMILPAFL